MTHPWPFSDPVSPFEFQSADGAFDDKVIRILKEQFVLYKETKGAQGSRSVCEFKLDGWRCLIGKHYETGDLFCYCRGISKVTGTYRNLLVADHKQPGGPIDAVTKLAEFLQPGDCVEVELCWEEHRAAEIPTALKLCRDELIVAVFAFPFQRGKRVGSWDKQNKIICQRELPRPVRYAGGCHMLTPEGLAKVADEKGIEGFMVKLCDTEDQWWWKVKPQQTIDVIVCSTKDSEGDIRGTTGMVGSLVVGIVCPDQFNSDGEYVDGQHDKSEQHQCWQIDLEDGKPILWVREIANVSGFSDEIRDEATKNRDNIVGRVCEIHAQASGGLVGGRLRHPEFDRWREDKSPRECLGKDIYSEARPEDEVEDTIQSGPANSTDTIHNES